jgi:hypothetical protein
VGNSHEFNKTRYAEDGVISVLEINNLKGEYLLAKVRRLTEHNP